MVVMTQAAIKLLLLGASGGLALSELSQGNWGFSLFYIAVGAAIFLFVQPRPLSA